MNFDQTWIVEHPQTGGYRFIDPVTRERILFLPAFMARELFDFMLSEYQEIPTRQEDAPAIEHLREQNETILRLRAHIEEARNAWWSATTQGDNGLVYTDKIEDAMDDIWSAIGHADWTPDSVGEVD